MCYHRMWYDNTGCIYFTVYVYTMCYMYNNRLKNTCRFSESQTRTIFTTRTRLAICRHGNFSLISIRACGAWLRIDGTGYTEIPNRTVLKIVTAQFTTRCNDNECNRSSSVFYNINTLNSCCKFK